jgi:Pyruvate/2-oxoacid:ferredoxin oxidoreductase delta subunit
VAGRVVVVGGGDTSIDVASVARRLGQITNIAEKDRPENVVLGYTAHDVADIARREGAEVLLISRHPLGNMTASEREVNDALHEGVQIRGCLNPIEVIKDLATGRAKALRVVELKYEGNKAVPIPGTEQDLDADLIVSAIGQSGDFRGLEDFNNGKGLINADKFYQVPNKPGIFVAGDIVRPHLLTTVIGQASVAVESIDHYLKHAELTRRPKVDVHHFDLLNKLREQGLQPQEFHATSEGVREVDRGLRGTSEQNFAVHNYEDRSTHQVIPAKELFLAHFEYEERQKRKETVPDAEQVLGHFEERLHGLSDAETIAEAKRCMSCGMCFECDNCVIFCPQEAVKRTPKTQATMGRYVYTDYARCIGCHICADVCPTGYIKMGLGE